MEKLLRKALNPDQYVTVQQIKSLYSRWAKLLKDDLLEEPKEKENLDTDKIDQGMDNTDDKGTNEKNYVKAIQEQVIICDFSMFDWTVILFYESNFVKVRLKINSMNFCWPTYKTKTRMNK